MKTKNVRARVLEQTEPLEERLAKNELEARRRFVQGKDSWKKITCPHCGEKFEMC